VTKATLKDALGIALKKTGYSVIRQKSARAIAERAAE
jgi:hypothetical protein